MKRLAVALLFPLLVLAGPRGYAQDANTTSSGPVTGLVMTKVLYKPPGLTGWPVHSSYSHPIRAIYTLWYQNPTHWRVAGHYLLAPRDAFLLRNGSLGSPFSPFPGIVVQRGGTIWHYSARQRQTNRIAARSDGMDPLDDRGNQVGFYLDGYRPRGLGDLLRHEGKCHRVTLLRTQPIAGRRAYLIQLGPNRCLRNSSAASDEAGPSKAWVGRGTFALLRYDLYLPGGFRLLFRVQVLRVAYETRIRRSLFQAP